MKTVIEYYGERYTDREVLQLRDAFMKVSKRSGYIGTYDEILSGLRRAVENTAIIKLYKVGGFD